MLTKVDISNYRGFKAYRMEGLTRVNLLVGKNNSGKTALLEAVHLVASGGGPAVLMETANRRGEVIPATEGRNTSTYPDLTHFFHGHELKVGGSFAVHADNGFPKLTVKLVAEAGQQSELLFDPELRPAFGVLFEGAATAWIPERPFAVSEMGGLLPDPRIRLRSGSSPDSGERRVTIFIPPESLGTRRLADLWRQVILEARQESVVGALRLIEPNLSEIIFLPGEIGFRATNAPSGIVARIAGFPRPIPLGSMGDGMRHLFALANALSNAADGFLFLDEIDTGLHYSVMADMWRIVIQTAISNRVQILATTHSWDCVDALKVLCKSEPSLREVAAVHKIDRVLDHSVAFQGDEFVRAVEGGVELR